MKSHSNGFRFGPGSFTDGPRAAPQLPQVLDGVSSAPHGFDLLDARGNLLGWFDEILDAIDALKASVGPGDIVRCSDRVLMKRRQPQRKKAA